MRARFRSGREMEIPDHHTVFVPEDACQEGDVIDPSTVHLLPTRPGRARPGQKLIVDNIVEVLDLVTST